MARSLARNTELFVSVNDNTLTGSTPENLFSIKVLDGYSFSQDVTTQEFGVNEAGSTPVRGTLGFNTALNPVDVSFSTYVRVQSGAEDVQGATAAGSVDCVERVLWASAMGDKASWDTVVTGTGPAAGEVITGQNTTSIDFGLGKSNTNTLMPLTLYFKLENTTYVITNFNVSTAEVDFSIDGIATINWSGNGARVTESQSDHAILAGLPNDNTRYKAVPDTTTKTFLRNKLSTLTLKNNDQGTPVYASPNATIAGVSGNTITFDTTTDTTSFTTDKNLVGGRVYNSNRTEYRTIVSITSNSVLVVDDNIAGQNAATAGWTAADECVIYDKLTDAGVVYTIPITGATLTLENNFTYLTPEELAIVNLPLAGFSGNRVISGSLTAYLNTGAQGSGGLLQDMLAKIEGSVTNSYQLVFHMGASATATPRVEFTLPTCQLAVPTTNVEDLISTEISFTSKPSSGGSGSFEATNELVLKYFI